MSCTNPFLSAADDNENADADGNEEEQEEEEDDLDEVIGYHFMECTTLFVSYIYVNSGKELMFGQ